jgi:hypothetical protein
MKGLRDAAGIDNAAVQCSATISSLILEDFEIDDQFGLGVRTRSRGLA